MTEDRAFAEALGRSPSLRDRKLRSLRGRPSEAAPRIDEHVGSASLGQCLIAPPPAGRRKLDSLG
jgi:hypothetical protein